MSPRPKYKRRKKLAPYIGPTDPMKPLPKPDTGCSNGQVIIEFDEK